MSAKDDIDLMQHADGELDARSVASVEKRLASDPEARTKAEALGEVSELVRGHVELAVDDVPESRFGRMWGSIEAATYAAPGRLSPQGAARAPSRAESRAGERGTGFWAAFAGWFDRYRGHVITGAISAGAVAALALVLRSGSSGETQPRGNAINVQPAALRMTPEIESMDTPDGEGTVLNLEDEDGHTTVIWVSTADTVEGI